MLATMEREFLAALRPGAVNIALAEERLTAIRSLGASPSRLAVLESTLLFKRDPMRKDEALRRVIDNVVLADVDDPVVTAKGCVQAAKWADMCNDLNAMKQTYECVKSLQERYGANAEVKRWCVAASLNVGVFMRRLKFYESAVELFAAMLDETFTDPMYACFHALAHENLALCYAWLNHIDLARDHAVLAARHAFPSMRAEVAFMNGVISFVCGDYTVSKRLFREAFDAAKANDDVYFMANAQLMLCHVFLAVGNVDAALCAVDATYVIAKNHGAVHVLDDLAEVVASINARKEETE